MTKVCRHCDETITGKAYRVVSQEDGVVLLNMVVCASCATVAKSLLLHTEEITPVRSICATAIDASSIRAFWTAEFDQTRNGKRVPEHEI